MKNFFKRLGRILKLLQWAIPLSIPFMWLFVQIVDKQEWEYWLIGFGIGILGYYLIIGIAYWLFQSLPRLIDTFSD